jgi:methylmalonyl-CoA/ethylmalonyl-CoA epimerase
MTDLSIFNTVHHITLIVHDIEKTAAFYESVGIGPWEILPSLEPYKHEIEVRDTDALLDLEFRHASVGDFHIFLCQPGAGDSDHKRFLAAHGEGVFSLGFSVGNVDEAEHKGRELGLVPLIRGRLPDRSGFTYFDTRREAGVILQLRQPKAV